LSLHAPLFDFSAYALILLILGQRQRSRLKIDI
jgi:hypothetical protein